MLCIRCKKDKPETEFEGKTKCATCRGYDRAYYLKNKERLKANYLKNKGILISNQSRYYERHKEKRIAYQLEYYRKNKDMVLEIGKERKRRLRANSPAYRLNASISRNMSYSLNGRKNGMRWEVLAGYTLQDLMSHLSKNFAEDMTFENYGKWEIDHSVPVSAFNFTTAEHEDFKRCWALSNLQPLWANENRKKSNKINKPFQPTLKLDVNTGNRTQLGVVPSSL